MKPLAEIAVGYARLGYRVVPLEERGKRPHRGLGKGGWQQATTNDSQVATWWTRWPEANIGLVTGGRLGFVLDVDRLEALAELPAPLPPTRTATTGSGGQHLFYALPPGVEIGNHRGRLPAGIDVRGCGTGYVVAPPSIHPSGERYRWSDRRAPAVAPGWLLDLIRDTQGQAQLALQSNVVQLRQPGPGRPGAEERARLWLARRDAAVSGQGGHAVTFRTAVGLVRGFDLDDATALRLLEQDYNPRCVPPWSARELQHKVGEARDKGDMAFGELLDVQPEPRARQPGQPAATAPAPEEKMVEPPPDPADDGEKWSIRQLWSGYSPDDGVEVDLLPVRAGIKDAPDPDAIVPHGYYLSRHATGSWWYSRRDEDWLHRPICDAPVVVAGRMRDIDSGGQLLLLAWKRSDGWTQRVIPRSEAARSRSLIALAEWGLPVNDLNAQDLVRYLEAYQTTNYDRIPTAQVATTMGWQGSHGSRGFLWGNVHFRPDGTHGSVDLEQLAPTEWPQDTVSFRELAEGDRQLVEAMRTEGTFEAWKAAVEALAPYPRAVLGLFAAFVPPMLEVIGGPNFIIDWANRTSTGKTTVLRVAASVWGDPDENSRSPLVRTWDATPIGVERTLEAIKNLPLCLDDTARVKRPGDVAAVLYAAAQGQGKTRGNTKRTDQTRTWRTVLLSTGEQAAVSFSEHGGTRARCLEILGGPFGRDDAETARFVTTLNLDLVANFGHAGPRFVAWLLRNRKSWRQVTADYQERARLFVETAEGGPEARLATVRAVLSLTIDCVRQALELELSDPLPQLWASIAEGVNDASGEVRALLDVVSWAYSNATSFHGRDGGRAPPGGFLGVWPGDHWTHIAIFQDKLKAYLDGAGYAPAAILPGWRERGFIVVDKGRRGFTKNVKVPGAGQHLLVCLAREAIARLTGENSGVDACVSGRVNGNSELF